jgi:hypothetical protein
MIPFHEELLFDLPLPSTRFALQEISDLSKTNWTDVPGALTLNFTNLQYQMTLPLAVIDRFYRLKH